jgi:hypothetical protein
MRRINIAAFLCIAAAFFAPSAIAANITLAPFEQGSRSAWLEVIEAEGAAVTKCCEGAWQRFDVAPAVPWNSGLWLSAGAYAEASFSVRSDTLVVQFEADANDGLAEFIVDGETVGTYETNNVGWFQVVISGLPNAQHTIQVVARGPLAIDSFGAISLSGEPQLRSNTFRLRVNPVAEGSIGPLGGVFISIELSQYADGMWTSGKTLSLKGPGLSQSVDVRGLSLGLTGSSDWIEFQTDELYRIDDFRNMPGTLTVWPGAGVVLSLSGGMTVSFLPPGRNPITVNTGAGFGTGIGITAVAVYTGTWQ